MRSLGDTLPTLREAAGTPDASPPPGVAFEPGAILKALRAKAADHSDAPRRTADDPPGPSGPSGPPGPSAPNPFGAGQLPRKSETRLSAPPFRSKLATAIEAFDQPAAKKPARDTGGEDIAEVRREALAEQERAVAAARAEEVEKAGAALAAERASWSEDTAEKLSAQIDKAFTELHNRLADAITLALTPVLEEAMRGKAVERFSASLERLMGRNGGVRPLVINGPQDLLDALAAARGGDTAGLKLVASEDSELVASVNDTTLRTTTKAWAAALAAATGSRHG